MSLSSGVAIAKVDYNGLMSSSSVASSRRRGSSDKPKLSQRMRFSSSHWMIACFAVLSLFRVHAQLEAVYTKDNSVKNKYRGGDAKTFHPLARQLVEQSIQGRKRTQQQGHSGNQQPKSKSTKQPRKAKTEKPSMSPSTSSKPNGNPSQKPSRNPSVNPSQMPSSGPTATQKPSRNPSENPSQDPTGKPTL
ncbi:hypothetical protein ACHAXA_002176 [Cyclostephanos tholiformis]|uniref:Uncharacterized protein n=1 Tax=Cyclostephanos tholiformis TaxID=382380 RepID=A0ABD3RVH9_9STRA